MASARPRRSPGEPLTRRRASSFCGAGRSTEEEGGLTRTEHLAQTGMRPRVPQGALPWKALPRHHLTVPAMESGSAQGMLIKNIILIGLPWEEWRTLLRPGENAMLFFQDLPPLPRESLLPPGNLGVTVRPLSRTLRHLRPKGRLWESASPSEQTRGLDQWAREGQAR